MNHLFKKAVIFSALSLVGGTALATPNVAPKCESDHHVTNPASAPATPYYYNDTCSTVYVAPPESGTVELTSFLEHVNLGSCDALQTAQDSADSRVETIDILQTLLNEISFDFVDQNSQWNIDYREAQNEQRESEANLLKAEANKENALSEQTFWESERNSALIDFSTCKNDYDLAVLLGQTTATLAAYCSNEVSAYQAASANVTNAMIDKLAADQAYNLANAEYSAAKNTTEDMVQELEDITARVTQIETTITAQRNLMQDIFTEYAQMYGGIGNISYASNWGDLVNSYQKSNKSSGLAFTKLPIDRAVVLISNDDRFVNPSEALAERTGVLNVSIPLLNLSNYGITDMPEGTTSDEGRLQNGLPDTFSGSAEFALALGCSIKENGGSDFANFVNVSTNFEYTLKSRGGYSATYDKVSFLEVIKKVASKNSWFFKRKTVRETSITEDTDIDFSIEFFADSEGFEFSAEEKDVIRDTVKERLTTEVLDAIGVRVGANSIEAELPDPAVASTLGQRYVSSCFYGGGWMCYGGWVLIGLDGLFGSQEAENRFRQENQTTATETYSDTFFVKKWGSLSYGS